MDDFRDENIFKKQRRCWFGTLWKAQEGFKNRNGIEYSGSPIYEKFRDYLITYESNHAGCKWAYAIHNKGHMMKDGYAHEDCEHIHFVIDQDNPITGQSLKNKFQGCHLETVKYSVEHCGRYLLHLTVSALTKDKIPLSDLYCSGSGEHGQIWFPLISAHTYETFVSNNVLHYVYNEGLHSMLAFMGRFGSCVTHGAYASAINTAIEVWNKGKIEPNFVRQVYETLDEDQKRKFLAEVQGINLSDVTLTDFRYNFIVNGYFKADDKTWARNFQKLYIWWKCSDEVMDYDLNAIADTYNLFKLLTLNDKRKTLRDTIERNSIVLQDLGEEIAKGTINDIA